MTLAVLGTKEAYLAVDRQNLYRWMVAMKDPNTGAFAAHEHGYVNFFQLGKIETLIRL